MGQILGDAIIQFDPYLMLDKLKAVKVIILPLFFSIYLFKSLTAEKLKFVYLVLLWFLIPWLVFTTYSGEISDYYFIINRFLVLFILAYFIKLLWSRKYKIIKVSLIVLFLIFAWINVRDFLPHTDTGLYKREQTAKQAVDSGRRIEFEVGVPESYLYYYYMRQKGIDPYGI
jgi:hypothetical protein